MKVSDPIQLPPATERRLKRLDRQIKTTAATVMEYAVDEYGIDRSKWTVDVKNGVIRPIPTDNDDG